MGCHRRRSHQKLVTLRTQNAAVWNELNIELLLHAPPTVIMAKKFCEHQRTGLEWYFAKLHVIVVVWWMHGNIEVAIRQEQRLCDEA